MRSIKLQELILRNFKGVKEFKFTPNGENANIFGDNATGKTTIYDAFLWLLFNKDSQNRADFEVKALGQSGEPAHGLEHEVTAVLAVDGKTVDLCKRFSEKWVKARGKASKEFTGHQTDYFINGVPVKAGEFKSAIADLIDEETFKLLTNPRYFNEVLKWERRREIILQVSGDVATDDVLAADQDLAALAQVLDTRSIDDQKKTIHVQRKRVNGELEKIPVRVDEATRSLAAVPDEPIGALKAKKNSLEAQVAAKQKEIAAIGKPEGQIDNLKKAMEIERSIQAKYRAFTDEKLERCRRVRKEIDACDTTTTALGRKKAGHQADIEKSSGDIKSCMNHLESLRLQWIQKNAETLPAFQDADTCPTCRQPLPCDMIEASRQRVTADFNLKKSQALERIAMSGNEFKTALSKMQADKAKAETDLAEAVKDIVRLESMKAHFEKQIATLESDEFKKDESALEEISRLRQESPDDIAVERDKKTLQAVLAHIQDELQAVNAGILAYESAEKVRARIEELKAQEKTLAAEFEALEEQLFLCEKFTRIRVKMLEDKIAGKFKMARFKMFHDQINEGIKDCCETLSQGVPYGNLNNAARINIGLDIISTLIDHYGVSAPIFVDNAEAVTALYLVPAQTIRLIVSESHKQLTIGA